MIEAAWDAGLPVLTSCDGCGGKCCREMRTPPYSWADGDKPPTPELVAEIRAAVMQPLSVRPDASPCIWLQPDGRCREYEHRPDICRSLRVGGPGCRRHRGELPDGWEHPDDDELSFDYGDDDDDTGGGAAARVLDQT